MRARRFITVVAMAALVALATAIPVAAARDFGTIYVDGVTYRTFGNPARVDPGTGTDPIVAFTNFDQPAVAKYAPGPGSHGGRWAVSVATWVDPTEARLLTHHAEVMALVAAGDLTLERVEEADFRCPILPAGRQG